MIGEEGDFLKLQIDDDLVGYAFKDYISVDTKYNEAISIEEENIILAEKKQREKEADEAIARLESDRAKESEAKLALSNESNNIESVKERNSKEASKKESTKKETKTEESSTKESTKKETKASTVQTRSKENVTVETKFADNTTIEKSKKETTKKETTKKETTKTETAKKESSKQESETAKPKKETKAATVPAGGDERDAIVAYAKQFLGNPYKYGGTSLTDGCDCSGFTMQVYSKFGYSIGRDSRTQSNASGNAIDESSLRKGDLIFYASDDTINHVGIYIGDGKIIHSSNSRTGITISPANYRSPAKILNILD